MAHPGLDTVIGGSMVARDPAGAAAAFSSGQRFEAAGDRLAAIDAYREASDKDRKTEYLFRLAFMLDLVGEESEALQLLQEVCSQAEPPINALMNLAILHEDRGEVHAAERVLRKVLEAQPDHQRARLYMKDIMASKDMLYDEGSEREGAKRSAMLDTPVTDFELTVRSRNCLKKMNVRTLGDLLKITESELLSYKNFGETSLTEIKLMLSQKGLRLGQGLDQGYFQRANKEYIDSLRAQVDPSVLSRPASTLDLSVRARKAIQLLNVQSIGELAARTEAELMGVKNFGQNSLDEIRGKLADLGLSLRQIQ